MERKLASIQKIISLDPIEGADFIEKATILGWECVVKKGDFKVNDLCVYFEIDSILPKDKEEFAFLESCNWRIKTTKRKKQVSQGLAVPLDSIKYVDVSPYNEEDDVTELLSIKKYDPQDAANIPACLRGKIKGNFPSFLKKTDEIRIQAVPKFLDRHRGKEFYYAEKVDGSSTSIYLNNGDFGVCSRNLDLKREEPSFEGDIKNAFWKAVNQLGIEEKFSKLKGNIALQGELLGPGIQQNKYQLINFDIMFYNAWDINVHRFFEFDEFISICNDIGVKTVPIIGKVILDHSVNDLVGMSRGDSVLYKTPREGFVWRAVNSEGDSDPKIGRLSFKVINPDFLLKHGE